MEEFVAADVDESCCCRYIGSETLSWSTWSGVILPVLLPPGTQTLRSPAAGTIFKPLYKVTLCNKCSRAMIFENFVQAFPHAENCYAEDPSIFVTYCWYLEKSCQHPETFPAARSENSQTMEESGHELSYMYICKYTHNCLCVDILLLSVGHRFITQLNICFCCPCY